MGEMASQITSLTIVYSIVHSGAKKNIKPRVTGLCVGNSPVTGEFPPQMASNVENTYIWWRHHEICTALFGYGYIFGIELARYLYSYTVGLL